MSSNRYTAIISSISNSFCDSVLDYMVSRFNYYQVLFLTSLSAAFIQTTVGLINGISMPVASLWYVVMHSVLILVGYIFFVKSLKYLPLALIGLIEASSLFLTFMIDAAMGYVEMSRYFIIMLSLFIFSIFLFTENSLKKGKDTVKNIKTIGIVYIAISVLLYLGGPYLVKLSAREGANEIAINLGYYAFAVPYFAFMFLKSEKNDKKPKNTIKKRWLKIYVLCLMIGCFESVYYIFETISFNNDAPTIVIVISQTRAFLLFVLSVILKTDKFTPKKLIAVLLGSASVTGIYFS